MTLRLIVAAIAVIVLFFTGYYLTWWLPVLAIIIGACCWVVLKAPTKRDRDESLREENECSDYRL